MMVLLRQMNMMKKGIASGTGNIENKVKLLPTLLILLSIMFITACSNGEFEDEEQQVMIPIEKLWYANFMQFSFRIIIEGGEYSIFPIVFDVVVPGDRFDPFYDELIFVYDEAEAANLPDNVIAAWPTDATLGMIEGLHWAVDRDEDDLRRHRREVISFEDFGLSYPLTIEDLLNQWEKVNELWNALAPSEQSFLIRAAPVGGPDVSQQSDDYDASEADDYDDE